MNKVIGSSTQPQQAMATLNTHFRSQSNPRAAQQSILNTDSAGQQNMKRSTVHQMMAVAGLSNTFYHKAQEQVVRQKRKQIKNSNVSTQRAAKQALLKYNTQQLQLAQHNSVPISGQPTVVGGKQSRIKNQTLRETELHQNWLNQTLPTYTQMGYQGHVDGGSGGVLDTTTGSSLQPGTYLNETTGFQSHKKKTSKGQSIIFNQQVRAKSTLSKNDMIGGGGGGNAQIFQTFTRNLNQPGVSLAENYALTEAPSSALHTQPYVYQQHQQTYQNSSLLQQQNVPKRVKKQNHSIGIVDNNELLSYIQQPHHGLSTLEQRRAPVTGQAKNSQQMNDMRMNQTIDAYTSLKQNQTLTIESQKKKMPIVIGNIQNVQKKASLNDSANKTQIQIVNYNKDRARSQLRQIVINNAKLKVNAQLNNFIVGGGVGQGEHPYSRQLNNYSPIRNNFLFHKRSESVNTQRPDQQTHQQSIYQTTQYKGGGGSQISEMTGAGTQQPQKKKDMNFNIKTGGAVVKGSGSKKINQREEEFSSQNFIATNSNISDKSSLMGDYGGTNTVGGQYPSNSHTRKAKGGTLNTQMNIGSAFNQSTFQNASQQNHEQIDSGVSSKISQQSYNGKEAVSATNNKKDSTKQRMFIMENAQKPIAPGVTGTKATIIQQQLKAGKAQNQAPPVKNHPLDTTNYTLGSGGIKITHGRDKASLKAQNERAINIIKEFDLNKSSDYEQDEELRRKRRADMDDDQDEDSDMGDDDEHEEPLEMDLVDDIIVPDINISKESSSSQTMATQNKLGLLGGGLFFDYENEQSSDPIFIQDDLENTTGGKQQRAAQALGSENKAAKFEIYESSSDDELSQGAFESAAQSFSKQEKGEKEGSKEREQKQKDKQRRAERKKLEKKKKKKDQDREKRKEQKLMEFHRNRNAASVCIDEVEEDILNFKDSDRESLISYLEKDYKRKNLVDTPTRLVNESNEFLERHIKKAKQSTGQNKQQKKEESESNLSSERKKELQKREELLKLLENQDTSLQQISDSIYRRMNRPRSNMRKASQKK